MELRESLRTIPASQMHCPLWHAQATHSWARGALLLISSPLAFKAAAALLSSCKFAAMSRYFTSESICIFSNCVQPICGEHIGRFSSMGLTSLSHPKSP